MLFEIQEKILLRILLALKLSFIAKTFIICREIEKV